MKNKEKETSKEQEKRKVPVKPYTTKQLAEIYGVCTKTFNKWIKSLKKELGERKGWYYSIPQVKIIFSELFLPSSIEVE